MEQPVRRLWRQLCPLPLNLGNHAEVRQDQSGGRGGGLPGDPWDVRKKSLIVAIRLAHDRVLARERQPEGVAKGLVNPLSAGVLLRGGQGLLSCVAGLDMTLAALDQLDVFHVGDGCPEGADVRPGAAAAREDHPVALAAGDALEDGEAAAARARPANLGVVRHADAGC
jgi:hypothetical protein